MRFATAAISVTQRLHMWIIWHAGRRQSAQTRAIDPKRLASVHLVWRRTLARRRRRSVCREGGKAYEEARAHQARARHRDAMRFWIAAGRGNRDYRRTEPRRPYERQSLDAS